MMLHTLNLYSELCKLYLNKTRRKNFLKFNMGEDEMILWLLVNNDSDDDIIMEISSICSF